MVNDVCISNIIDIIDSLKKKISEHRDLFLRNEMLVRYVLIDPFLRVLGWDTSDPSQVIPEYSTETGKPDYVLKIGDNIIALIEAKALSKPWDPVKLISYANAEGISYAIVTDGDEWKVYDVFKRVGFNEKLIVSWSIVKESPAEIVLKSLAIANLGDNRVFGKTIIESIFRKNVEEIGSRIEGKIRGPMNKNLARELILKVLQKKGEPLPVQEILNEIARIFESTDKDLEILSGKEERWKNMVRWELSHLVKEGLIKRLKVGEYSL